MNPSQASIVAGSYGASAAQQRRAWLYLLPILLVPVVVVLAAWFVLPSLWFRMRSQNTYLANLGYGTRLHGRTCDILIYGDSTAMAGIDPRMLEQRTGLKACNIAEGVGVPEVVHLLPVDDFLAHNPRPRYMVFYFAPFNFNMFTQWNDELRNSGEGISYLIDHQTTGRAALTLAMHPASYFTWAEGGLRLLLMHGMDKPYSPDVFKLRDDTGGRFVFPNTRPTTCDPSTAYRDRADLAFISYLRTHYATGGTHVLVDAAPTATCDPNLAYYREHVIEYVDNKPWPVLPLSAFSASPRLHVNDEGSPTVTAMVATQINTLAHSGGGN
jgi:hypothetical protein